MPTPPKVCHAGCCIGIIEVFEEPEAKDPAQTNGHIGITREIKVDLECEKDRTQPGQGHGKLLSLDLCQQCAAAVGQQYFLCKAEHEPAQSVCNVIQRFFSGIQFLLNIPIAHNGTCDQLRKQRNIGAEP